MTIAIVLGSNAPYCNRLFDAYAQRHGADLHVFQCAAREPSRQWRPPEARHYRLITLPGLRHHKSDISHVYFNPRIVSELNRLKPDTVVMGSFSPTMIMAGLYAVAAGSSLGLFIEGTRELDPGERSAPHALARRFFARRASFGICTSQGSVDMKEHWGLRKGAGVLVPHFGSWDAPPEIPPIETRPYDLLFCGTINERKNPMFFAEVVERLVAQGARPTVRIVGDGPLREAFAARLAACGVEPRIDGYLQTEGLIEAYRSAKVLLFPTRADTWGLVANEALLCGTAVLASPHAVSSKELVERYGTGLVRALDAETWAGTAREMLSSAAMLRSFAHRRREAMAYYSLETAVAGLARAIETGRTSSDRRIAAPGRSDTVGTG